ncbi:hypothetical protein [Nitrospira sp. Nam80]
MSAPIVRVGDLEINQDLPVQHRMWRIQRVGWAAMGLIVLSGLAGLFGHGPLSDTIAGDIHGPLWVEYERFGRYEGSSELRIHVKPGQASNGSVRIWLGPDYTGRVNIQRITPEPVTSGMADNGLLFEVTMTGKQESGIITLNLQFIDVGWVTGELRSPGVAAIPVRQFVYP